MKTLKSLFMLCAGLSFCACSSDNDQLPEGNAAITIKVSLPNTRAEVAPSYDGVEGDDKVTVEGTIYVKLTTATETRLETITSGNEVTFWGISGPQQVEAWVNGGKTVNDSKPAINTSASTSNPETDYDMQALATAVPAYKSIAITDAHLTKDSEYNEGKSYQMYRASLEMEIPVARIEFAVNYDFTSSKFTNLDFQGVYLDNVKATPTTSPGADCDYRHEEDVDNADYKTTATGSAAILKDYKDLAIAGNSGTLPESPKVYAYNVYPGTLPQIKLFFNGAESTSEYVFPYLYAVVKSYKNSSATAITEFEAGKIYRVTALNLTEDNLANKEDGTDGDVEYGIEVTVQEAKWDVVDTTGSWTKP
ncbi:MAG: hypothetical protein IKK07_00125 [Bacteroides sp.]|nr:hypothetical protein [Bacteroides sp.]